MEQGTPGTVSNTGKMAKATTLLFLMAIILTEGARDMPLKDQVYSPQGLLGLWGLLYLVCHFPSLNHPHVSGMEDHAAEVCFHSSGNLKLGHPSRISLELMSMAMPLTHPHDPAGTGVHSHRRFNCSHVNKDRTT